MTSAPTPVRAVTFVLLAASLAVCACHRGQAAAAGGAGGLALGDLPTTKKEAIQVSSLAFPAGGRIPDVYGENGAGVSPPIAWTPVVDAQSYAVIVEDPDAPTPQPFVHWLVWNLPPQTNQLMQNQASTAAPEGMREGKNGNGSNGWWGPHPPAGAAHHYHFQVFALDTAVLPVPAGADRARLVAGMKGHVVAEGELVGLYQKK
jgi:Raf kinase inhibitor-like YbhB/YbcL family protein